LYRFFLLFLAVFVYADTIVVGDCEDGDKNVNSIRVALNQAKDGDTIKICKGTYNDEVTVDVDDLTITNGSDAQEVGDVNWTAVNVPLTIDNDISGFLLQNIYIASDNDDAIYIEDANKNITFKNLIVHSSSESAIYAPHSFNDVTIEDCNITAKNYAVRLRQIYEFVKIDNCEINSTDYRGVYVKYNVGDTNITDTKIYAYDDTFRVDGNVTGSIYINSTYMESNSSDNMQFVGYTQDINLKDSNLTADEYNLLFENNVTSSVNVAYSNLYSYTKTNLRFEQNISGDINVSDSNLTSEKYRNIDINGTSQNTLIQNSKLNSYSKSIYFTLQTKNLSILNSEINSSNGNGIFFEGKSSKTYLSGVKLVSYYSCIRVEDESDDDMVIESSDLNSTNSNGIYVKATKIKNLFIKESNVTAVGYGVYVPETDSLEINASLISTESKNAVDIGSDVGYVLIYSNNISNNADASDTYGIYVHSNVNDINVTYNCFYAPNGGSFAYDAKSTHSWDGNYWDGVKDGNDDGEITTDDTDKINDNIVDHHPYFTCRSSLMCSAVYEGYITPLEMEAGSVTLKDTYKDPTWTHVDFSREFKTTPVVFSVANSTGGDPASIRIKNVTTKGFDITIAEPQGEDGPHVSQTVSFYAINKGVHIIDTHVVEVGTIDTKKVQGKYVLDGSDVGWDVIDPKAEYCNPMVLANIQTVNNEKNDVPDKNANPWITAVVKFEDNGNIDVSLDMSETNESVVTEDETVGYLISDADFAGYITDDNGKEIKFEILRRDKYFKGWTNGCYNVDYINTYSDTPLGVGWKDSRYGPDGGWFRECNRTETNIGYCVDEDRNHDSERGHIAETGGIFVVAEAFHHIADDLLRSFDSWDVFRDINERNISTKTVNKEFNVTIASLTDDGSDYKEFNGTVCARIVSDHYTGDWNKTLWNNEKEKNITLVGSSAIKDSKVYIKWLVNDDIDCSEMDDSYDTNSTDDFALIPYRFKITAPSDITAGKEFNITVYAVDPAGGKVKDYNETITLSSSPELEVNETKSGCKTGVLEIVSGGVFKDGETNLTLKYPEVGEINLSVLEINGSEFALVDSEDTPDDERLIQKDLVQVQSVVDHFDVNADIENYGNGFTYLDESLGVYAPVEINITALNADNEVTENYNTECYAKDVEINATFKLSYNNDNINVTKSRYYYTDAKGNKIGDYNGSDIENNQTYVAFTYTEGNFTTDKNGSTTLKIALNFDKNITSPSNPFLVEIEDINVSNEDTSVYTLNKNSNAVFYYGNLLLDDIISVKDDFSKTYSFVLYDENETDGLKPDSKELLINWYENTLHSQNDSDIQNSEIFISKDYNSSNTLSGVDVSVNSISSGEVTFDISRTSSDVNFAVVHLLSPALRHLWYSRFNNAYDISDGSTCLNHFCFTITWQNSSSESGSVGSGEFEGTESNVTDVNNSKRGVKIFR